MIDITYGAINFPKNHKLSDELDSEFIDMILKYESFNLIVYENNIFPCISYYDSDGKRIIINKNKNKYIIYISDINLYEKQMYNILEFDEKLSKVELEEKIKEYVDFQKSISDNIMEDELIELMIIYDLFPNVNGITSTKIYFSRPIESIIVEKLSKNYKLNKSDVLVYYCPGGLLDNTLKHIQLCQKEIITTIYNEVKKYTPILEKMFSIE